MLGQRLPPQAPAVGAASAAGSAYVAAAHGDLDEAVRRLRPLAESNTLDDAAAQFLMAMFYQTGQGVPRDDSRACALYHRASRADQTPFGYAALRMMRALWMLHDNEWFAACQALGNLGLDHRFEPVTFALGPGYEVSWDFTGATITYKGESRTSRLLEAPRGSAYLPVMHTTLYTGKARTKRDFFSVFFWDSAGGAWQLEWRLFEVTPNGIRGVGGAPALVTRDHRPSPSEAPDPATLVAVRVNALGLAEWAVLDPAHPRSGTIDSDR